MARLAGVDLPREKRMEIALTYIYGIGRSRSNRILAKSGVNPDIRAAMSTTTNSEGGYTTALEYQRSVEQALKEYGVDLVPWADLDPFLSAAGRAGGRGRLARPDSVSLTTKYIIFI